MKKLASALFLLLAVTANLFAQVGPTSGGGGSVASGTAIGSCTSSLLYTDASTLLGCNPAAVVNGSVSTAGRSILTIRDTISGSSASSNFWNLTGSFPATLSADTSAALISITGDNDAQQQFGLDVSLASTASTITTPSAAIRGIASGAAGTVSGGIFGTSASASTTYSLITRATGASTANAGLFSSASGSTTTGVGGEFVGGNVTNSYGVQAYADSDSTAAIAVWGILQSSNPGVATGIDTPTGKAAIVADNGSVAANIFEARDNGTAVFTIADGGVVTASSNVRFNGATNYLGGTNKIWDLGGGGTIGGIGYSSSTTPDKMVLYTGATPNAIDIYEYSDFQLFDFQNPCTTGLGTAACTDPTLIVHSHNQDTGEFLSMAHDGKAGVLAGGNSTVLDGLIRLGGTVTLTESTATTVLTIPIPVTTGSGGFINYVVDARDATNVQIRTGNVSFAVANNSGGTETCNVFGLGPTTQAAGGNTTNPANPTEVQDGSGTGAITSGTLTYAWSVDTTGTNSCVLKLNAVSSLTQTTLQVHYTVISTGPAIVTGG